MQSREPSRVFLKSLPWKKHIRPTNIIGSIEFPAARHALDVLPVELWLDIFRNLTPPYTLPDTKPFDIFLVPHFPTQEAIIESTVAKHALLLTCRTFHDMVLRDLYAIIPLSTVAQAVSLLRVVRSSEHHAQLLRGRTRRLDLCIVGINSRHEHRDSHRTALRTNLHILTGPLIDLSSYFGGLHHLNIDGSVYQTEIDSHAFMDFRAALDRLSYMATLRSLQVANFLRPTTAAAPALHTVRAAKAAELQALCESLPWNFPVLSSVILAPREDNDSLYSTHTQLEIEMLIATLGWHDQTIKSLALLCPVQSAVVRNALGAYMPNLQHLITDLTQDRKLPPLFSTTRTFRLDTLGLFRRENRASTPVVWQEVVTFASMTGIKSIRLLSPNLRENLHAQPDVLASLTADMGTLGVTIEDDMGRVITPALPGSRNNASAISKIFRRITNFVI